MSNAADAYLLTTLLNEAEQNQGTAWFASSDLVVTAFHVVGINNQVWATDHYEAPAHYRLELPGETVELVPVVANPTIDIALLKPVKPIAQINSLKIATESAARGEGWNSTGYPEFHGNKPFGIGGTVTAVHSNIRPDDLQLLINENTDARWEGISGAPVLIANKVSGVVTEVTPGVHTIWASPVAALRALIEFSESSYLIEQLKDELQSSIETIEELTELANAIQFDLPVTYLLHTSFARHDTSLGKRRMVHSTKS